MDRVLAHLDRHGEELLSDVRRLVELESPTGEPARVDAVSATVAEWWQALSAEQTAHPVEGIGHHRVLRWSGSAPASAPALLVGHADTVHDVGMLDRNPLRLEDGRLWGPGTQDMKAGLVMATWAVRTLDALDIAPARPVTFLVTADEETGSATSAELIRALAAESAHAFVLEASGPDGELKTERKGVALYELAVTGRAAHAGVDFGSGRSALVALARLVGETAALTDLDADTTVNVGVMHGGTRANVVAERARAQVDVRFREPEESERVGAALRAMATSASTDGLRVAVEGGVNRPAMRRSEAAARLVGEAGALAGTLGLALGEIAVGGASDGNLTAAAGCPTLDGLGAVGAGLHTAEEWIDVAALVPRTALLAGLLART